METPPNKHLITVFLRVKMYLRNVQTCSQQHFLITYLIISYTFHMFSQIHHEGLFQWWEQDTLHCRNQFVLTKICISKCPITTFSSPSSLQHCENYENGTRQVCVTSVLIICSLHIEFCKRAFISPD